MHNTPKGRTKANKKGNVFPQSRNIRIVASPRAQAQAKRLLILFLRGGVDQIGPPLKGITVAIISEIMLCDGRQISKSQSQFLQTTAVAVADNLAIDHLFAH